MKTSNLAFLKMNNNLITFLKSCLGNEIFCKNKIGKKQQNVVRIMISGLVNPKVRAKKMLLILNTPEHVDSEYIKLKIDSWSLFYQL
jgi:hypothetical protein